MKFPAPSEKDIRNLSCLTANCVVARCVSRAGMPEPSKVQKMILSALRIATGEEKMVDWNNPYDDERFML